MQVNSRALRLAELCSDLVRRLRLLERTEMACCGVPLSQAMVLQALDAHRSGRRMSELADALGVAQSTATRLVEPLAAQGLVRRESAAEDGRVVVIRLTPRGERLARELALASHRWSEGVLSRIDPDEHEKVIGALERVVRAVSDCCSNGCEPGPARLESATAATGRQRRKR